MVESYELETDTWEVGKAQFLKRQFRKDASNPFFYYPILDRASVHSMFLWYRPNVKIHSTDLIIQNFEAGMREIAFYPAFEWDKYYNLLLPFIRTLRPNYSIKFSRMDVISNSS